MSIVNDVRLDGLHEWLLVWIGKGLYRSATEFPIKLPKQDRLLARMPIHDSRSTIHYNHPMPSSRLDRVQQQLRFYEHPLVMFDAREKGEGVEFIIRPRFTEPPLHTYYFDLHPRDLDDPQFEWTFQRQVFDCLHDYLVEMFIRTPQSRKEHQRMEREGTL